jgi:hypothetical protein
MKLLMHKGAESVTHGTESYIVNNGSWIVEVPDHVGRFMLDDGRSGCVLYEPPEGEGRLISCPCCHYSWREPPDEREE